MNELARVDQTISLEVAAKAAAQGGLFGRMTEPQILSLFLLAQAEGIHPFKALQEYDIIQGRPALKQSAALARFQRDGGKVEWLERTEQRVTGRFSHPAGGTLEVSWDIDRAKKIGLAGKDNWRNYPREMLTWRCVAEGVRAVAPGVLQGMYLDAEVRDFATPDDEYQSVFEDEPYKIVPPDPQTNSSGPGYVPPAQRTPPDRGAEVPPVDNVVQAASALDKRVAAAIESQGPQVYQVVNGVTFDYTVPKGRPNAGEPVIGIEYTLIDSQEYQHTARYWEYGKAQERSGLDSPQLWRGEIRCKLVQRGKNPYQDMSALEYVTTATQQVQDMDGAELPPLSTGV